MIAQPVPPIVVPEVEARIEVDGSSRPVIVLYWGSSLIWLTIASLAGLISSIELHSPEFLGGMEWLTFGRIRAVHWDTAIYGFGGLAASGTLLWLQARLCQVRLFAMMYYGTPRLMDQEWSSARLIRIHFWCTLVGMLIYVFAMCYAGIRQGLMMNDPSIPFLNIVRFTIPYLALRTLGGLILLTGTIAFLINFVRIITPHKYTWKTPTMLDSERNWKDLVDKEKNDN